MYQLGAKSIGSLSNCFVVGQPEDSYGGIFRKDEEMAQLMKRRGGVGVDISTLRPQGTSTSNAAKSSSGAVSFMHRFSNTTREVAQNGRRKIFLV
jgi:ribonucleoside-diphosphate reductase alpha chain